MYETLALGGKPTNQLPISSVCNAKCVFCSNKMNPFPILREGFRPLEDVKKGIALLDPQAEEIRLGDSLPGRISEGEALLHPDILTILPLVRKKAPHSALQINTNGSMLTKEFIASLMPFKPMKLTISYHSDNPKHWCKIFSLGRNEYKVAYESFYYLSMNGFVIEAVMVPLPHLVGYADLENTIKVLKAWTNHLMIYLPGYSFKASEELKKLLDVDFRELSSFFIQMRKKYKIEIFVQPDLFRPLGFNPYALMLRTCKAKYQNVLWLLSEAAFKRARHILEAWNPFVPNDHFAFIASNRTYRGNIICSGLLMVSDYRKAIQRALAEFKNKNINIDLVLLPKNAFDRFGDDLTGENFSTLKDEFNIPIWVETC